MKTCLLCKGTGSLFVMYKRKAEWYDCPACLRNGCRDPSPFACMSIGKEQMKYMKPSLTKARRDTKSLV